MLYISINIKRIAQVKAKGSTKNNSDSEGRI